MHKINKYIILFLLFALSVPAAADEPDTTQFEKYYSWTLEAMGGVSYNLRKFEFKTKRLNYTPSLRLLWKPAHRLNIGVEASYLLLGLGEDDINDKKYGKGKFEGRLEAVPVFLVFNMRFFTLDWTAGLGAAYMRSIIISFNEQAISYNWHYCFHLGLGFSFDIWDNFGIGMEGKTYAFTKTGQYLASLQLKLIYHFLY